MKAVIKELAVLVAKAAEDKKANDVLILDLSGISVITDYFIIAGGNSTTQVGAIADHIEEELEKAGHRALRREGLKDGRWILLDYGDFVAHVFINEERQYYNLERLWGDAKVVPVLSKELI